MKDNDNPQKGRILRVKNGYNPNSSSIGSGILPFLSFAVGAGVFTIILSNALAAAQKSIKKQLTPGEASKSSKDS